MIPEDIPIQKLGWVGTGKTYELDYKLHLAVDSASELPLAFKVAPANENEKKHASRLLEKAVKAAYGKVKVFVADSQYSSQRLRRKISSSGVEPVIHIPRTSIQKRRSFYA